MGRRPRRLLALGLPVRPTRATARLPGGSPLSAARANRAPRLGSLCTGYGGLDLAASAVFGARPAWFADNDPDAAKVLAHHHRRVPNLGDITALDFTDRRTGAPGPDPHGRLAVPRHLHRRTRRRTEERQQKWPVVHRRTGPPFATYDPISCCWKTSLSCEGEDSTKSKPTWPAAGTTRNGSAFERPR